MWPSTLRGDAHPAGSQVTLRGGAVVAWWPPLRLAGAGEPGSAVSEGFLTQLMSGALVRMAALRLLSTSARR